MECHNYGELPCEPLQLSDPIEYTADELQAIELERYTLQEEVQTLLQEKVAFQEYMDIHRQEIEASKSRAKEIWRMSCE